MSLNFSIKDQKSEEGIGLVEVIISLGVAMIVVTAMISLSIFTLRTSTQSELLMESTRLANQQLERVRAARDEFDNWDDFYNAATGDSCSTSCSEEDAVQACYVNTGSSFTITRGSNPPTGSDAKVTTCFFVSEVDLPSGGTDTSKLDITSVATWQIGGERKYTHSYTRLSDWQN